MKGKDLQKSVIDMAHLYRWHVAHFTVVQDARGVWRTPAKADGKGWPDLFLVRERAVAIEVKGDGDSLKPEQLEWRDRIQRAGIEWYAIRPADWPDKVKEILA